MPVLKHAKKKQRQDKKRTLGNKKVRELYKKLIKAAKANPTAEAVSAAVSNVDKAVKKQVIHKNKAARIKASLSKLKPGEKTVVATKKAQGKSAKKKTSSKSKTK